jgi:PAS domain S-box-containing protein
MSDDITDRTRVEEALREAKYAAEASKAQYEQIVSMISDIIWSYDVDAQAQPIGSYISPVADRMLGLPDGTIGNSFDKYFSYIHPDDLPAMQEMLSEGMRTLAKDLTAEYRLRKADGSTLWVRSRGSAYSLPDGRITAFGTTSEISERRKAMREIESLAKFPDENPNPVLRIAADGTVIYANRGSASLLEQWGCRVGQSLPSVFGNLIQEALRSGDCIEIEIVSGSITYLLVFAPIADLGYVNIYGQNISERKRAEEAQCESELELRTIFETSSAGIIIVDTKGQVAQANQRMAEMFAWPLDSMVGTSYPAFIHPDERQDGTDIMQAMMENRVDTVYTERHYLRGDGSDFWGYISGRRMVGSNGEFTGLLGIISDITDRKRAEDELRWKTALLEAQFETSLDGILVVDSQGQQILANQRFLTMWKVPQEIRNERNDEALLQYLVGKTKNPDQFLEKVRYLYGHQDETSRDEIEFKDGMVLDRYSSPVIGRDGKYYGRIWIFHDITDYKHALDALC